MKRFGTLILIGCILLCGLCGCSSPSESDSMLDYVNLCDYTSLTIQKEECIVSDEELNMAVQLNLSSLDIEASEITDEIAIKHLNADNAAIAKDDIKKEIVETRYYEAARNIIFESSEVLSFPAYCEEYVDKLADMHRECAKDEGISDTEYFQNTFAMTEAEYREAAMWGYADLMILKAIAEKENYQITSKERSEIIEYTATLDGVTPEEAVETYGEEYFDYILYEKFLKELIVETYSNAILAIMKI